MSITLITVCHKSRQKIAAYISSFLEHHTGADDRAMYQFVFVENSGDSSFQSAVQPLRDSGFEVVVQHTANEGFGRGCNTGATYATGDILIFANPDIRFMGNLATLHAHTGRPFWGTVRQITPSGKAYSIDLFPEYKGVIFELFKLYHLINWVPTWFLRRSYVVGSFLIVSKDLFVKSGGFDPKFFLYYEEAELARRLQAICGPPGIEAQIEVFHEGFGSHNSQVEIYRHEANGFFTYCQVTQQPGLLCARLRTLKLMGMVSESSRKRFHVLKVVAVQPPHE
jgi:N-acetylglucosaminyl-diphospho-decaprenol L-rhamnosyltransferase